MRRFARVGFFFGFAVAAFIPVELHAQARPTRASLISHAEMWAPADISSKNLRVGPADPGSFAPGETVRCDYLDKELDGNSEVRLRDPARR